MSEYLDIERLTQEELLILLDKVSTTSDDDALFEVIAELARARSRFPAFHSAHEGYAVLLEEVGELWDEVKKNPTTRDLVQLRKEAVQVAAMALRFIVDVCDEKEKA